MVCPKCCGEIGSKEFYIEERDKKDENKMIMIKDYKMITSNKNYWRIFKDSEKIDSLKRNKEHYKKFENKKYMTVEEFKKKYIESLYKREKGLNKIDINIFRKENKVIRN